MGKIFITGILGYIGSYLHTVLLGKGYQVYGLDNVDTHVNYGENIRNIDLRDKCKTINYLSEVKPDTIIHLAASIQVGESEILPMEYYENNVSSTIHLLEAMKECGCKKLIFASTAAVYSASDELLTEESPIAPASVYGRTKYMCEQIIEEAYRKNILNRAILFRFFNVMGGDRIPTHCVHLFPILLGKLKKRETIEIFGSNYDTPDGTCIRDYISLEDLSRAHLLALSKFSNEEENRFFERINLGTSHGYSVMDVVKTFFKHSGIVLPMEIKERRAGDPAILVASNQKAKKLLGWEPLLTIEDSITQLLSLS